mmetsp:Transcript_51659/g.77083  ORF Transcript_51659/g.77083 Transcript_51659/m.77083 type:complete len:208 (-) Transcript_51659:468-1091(-)
MVVATTEIEWNRLRDFLFCKYRIQVTRGSRTSNRNTAGLIQILDLPLYVLWSIVKIQRQLQWDRRWRWCNESWRGQRNRCPVGENTKTQGAVSQRKPIDGHGGIRIEGDSSDSYLEFAVACRATNMSAEILWRLVVDEEVVAGCGSTRTSRDGWIIVQSHGKLLRHGLTGVFASVVPKVCLHRFATKHVLYNHFPANVLRQFFHLNR